MQQRFETSTRKKQEFQEKTGTKAELKKQEGKEQGEGQESSSACSERE